MLLSRLIPSRTSSRSGMDIFIRRASVSFAAPLVNSVRKCATRVSLLDGEYQGAWVGGIEHECFRLHHTVPEAIYGDDSLEVGSEKEV